MAPLPIVDASFAASTAIANITALRITIYLLQFLLCLLFLHALPHADAIRCPDHPLRQKDVLELPTLPLTAALATRQRRRRRDMIALRAIDASTLTHADTPRKKDRITTDLIQETITTDLIQETITTSMKSPTTTCIPSGSKVTNVKVY